MKSEARPATDDEFDALEKFMEDKLGLPATFLTEVSKENDWTLVIKLHAMIESTLNDILAIRFNAPEELKDLIARMDTGDTRRGKIAFAHKFGWIEKYEMTFVQKFSTLRNFLVHDAKNFGFKLNSYADTLGDEGQPWVRLLARFIPENVICLTERVSSLEHAKIKPRNGIMNGFLVVMSKLLRARDALLRHHAGEESTPKVPTESPLPSLPPLL